MNPLKRAAQALAGVCPVPTLRTLALLTVAGSCLFANSSQALMSRTGRPHARPAAQDQEPALTHNRASRRKAAKNAPAAQAAHKPDRRSRKAAPPTRTHGKARHSHPAPEPVDDPITFHRVKGRNAAKPEPHSHPLAAAHVEAPAAAAPHHAVAHRAQPPADAEEAAISATTDDFVRAAGDRAAASQPGAKTSGEAFAQGTAHPDELTDEQPLPPPKNAAPARIDHASAALPEVPSTAPARIDGFGAEGLPASSSHRTLAKTMAAHRSGTAATVPPVPVPAPLSAAEQEEITDQAVKPMVVPAVYTRGGRLVMPAPLKGSRDVLVHQNLMADNEGLERIRDEEQLDRMVAEHQLARLPEGGALHLNPELPENRRYARPWTVKFAADTAHAFSARFGVPLQVNSAVRTVSYQLRLMRVNGNAAATDGDTASPHLTGQAIDIGKRSMSKAQLAWMRAYLLPLMQSGKVDVEEEFHQACFHVSVYRTYAPGTERRLRTEVAQVHHGAAAAPVHPLDADQ